MRVRQIGESTLYRTGNNMSSRISHLGRLLILLVFTVAIACSICSAQSPAKREGRPAADAPSPGWRRIDLQDFSFYLPRGMKDKKVRGIDSFVREYRGGGVRLAIDYGMYSDDLRSMEGKPGFRAEWVSISGERAKVATCRWGKSYVAAVYFPNLGGDAASGITKLTFYAESRSAGGQEEALKVFQSIKFRRRPAS